MVEAVIEAPPATLVKLNIGSGPNKMPGYISVDVLPFDGKVDVVVNLAKDKWPWEDSSVDEIHCSHFLEHLTNFNDKWERVHFFNEVYRVLKPWTSAATDANGPKATLIFPHWCSNRFYGDPTHKEPFSEMGFAYIDKDWRAANAPHVDSRTAPGPQAYSCDFSYSYGTSLHPAIIPRNAEYQQHALTFFKEASQDIIATIKARK